MQSGKWCEHQCLGRSMISKIKKSHRVPTTNMNSMGDLRDSNLIDPETSSWNGNSLQEYFFAEDIELIHDVPLSSRGPTDVRYGWSAADVTFSTKTGYWLGRLGHVRRWEQ